MMRKFLAALFSVLVCSTVAILAACKPGEEPKKPEKLKDGIALTLTVGGSESINLTEYISIEGTDYVYEVSSSNDGVVTAVIDGSLAVISAVSKGEATVTASADEVFVTFAVTVNEKSAQPEEKPAPVFDDVTVEYDLKDESSKSVTLAPKSGASTFSYTYALKQNDENVTVAGDVLTVAYGEAVEKELIIVAAYTDGENAAVGAKTVEFNLNISVTDSREQADPDEIYKVVNGGFDDGLTGWTMEGGIGEISEASTFWEQGFPIFNDGKYFSGNNMEGKKGTLASSFFVVGGVNKISFKLGAAGNGECYITLENEAGEVLAIWRNTKFADVGDWKMEEIGKTQFACNLVNYVADLSAYAGQKVRVVLHDNAENGFGFFNFDSLVTYYAENGAVPEGETAVNRLANKTALKSVLDNALTEQGDYTQQSYAAYAEKIAQAQEIYDKLSATQSQVNDAITAVETAYGALAVRVPEEKEDADKAFSLLAGKNKQLAISDYVDAKDLSSITYFVEAADEKVSVSEITDGKFTVTAGADEAETSVTITVKYKDSTVLTVTVTVTVTCETAPVLKQTAVVKETDLYSAENKTEITIDFASNIENVGELELTYAAELEGASITLDGAVYTYVLGNNYTETPTEVVFAVKISYNANGANSELEYTYTLKIIDTRAYRIVNGTFDNGLEGWTLSNPDLGDVNSQSEYWTEKIPFNNDGNFFNAYAVDKESAMGTLTSSPFTIGGSGWITYKLGGAKNADKVYLDVIEKDTGNIVARYYNNAFSDDGASLTIRGCTLVAYKADLSAHIGKTVYLRLTDNAVRDYGLFFADSFVTYNKEIPVEGADAVAVRSAPENIYQVLNGGFETGDLSGWELIEGEVSGKVSNLTGYWGDNHPYNKDGEWLFTGAEGQNFETDPNLEYRKGTLRSNVFTLKAGGWISFKLGGTINVDATNIKVVKADGSVLAVFHNTNPASPEGGLIQYVYQFEDLTEDTECYIEIFDNAESGWGLITADSFITDYTAAPELDGAITAVNKK